MLSDASSNESPEELAVEEDEVSNDDAIEIIEEEANQPEQFNIDLACEHNVNASYLISFERKKKMLNFFVAIVFRQFGTSGWCTIFGTESQLYFTNYIS